MERCWSSSTCLDIFEGDDFLLRAILHCVCIVTTYATRWTNVRPQFWANRSIEDIARWMGFVHLLWFFIVCAKYTMLIAAIENEERKK